MNITKKKEKNKMTIFIFLGLLMIGIIAVMGMKATGAL